MAEARRAICTPTDLPGKLRSIHAKSKRSIGSAASRKGRDARVPEAVGNTTNSPRLVVDSGEAAGD